MIRPSAQLRATIQRTTPPLLILLSAAIIILGKADQSMFESLRTKLTDDAAPALDVLSRPFGAAASLVDRHDLIQRDLGGAVGILIQSLHDLILGRDAAPRTNAIDS